ncbi:MAG: FAD-dependent oxidoreductase [Candidatus Sericytochromatia bacterium]|nr:FAD-dependent oxidoreductase [Candidatus Tanganyikabacteria bacterium]
MSLRDFDLLVLGHETEGALAAVAAGRAGARAGIVLPPGRMLGGLLTEGGLAYVDRDSRHLRPPAESPDDGLFGEFLARAGVPLVALDPARGEQALRAMVAEAGATILPGSWDGPRIEGDRVAAVRVAGEEIGAGFFLDATPDGDFLEALGEPFAAGFGEYGIDRVLGVSPLPVLRGVTPARILATCEALAGDPDLGALKDRIFGERRFLDLEAGADYVLVGPPYLALAYQRWREANGLSFPVPFEADGFNVAVLGPDVTSWNGLIYFETDPATLLAWSRGGAGDLFRREVAHFGEFARTLWPGATAEMPRHGLYVRQTRHALGTRLRLSLGMIAAGEPVRSVGTFCYYPDFRGFRVTPTAGPLVARVALDAGLARRHINVGIASRAGGYTPPAHSLCRLVQYNATLGAALGAGAAVGFETAAIRAELARQHALADDQAGLADTPRVAGRLHEDPLLALERRLAIS